MKTHTRLIAAAFAALALLTLTVSAQPPGHFPITPGGIIVRGINNGLRPRPIVALPIFPLSSPFAYYAGRPFYPMPIPVPMYVNSGVPAGEMTYMPPAPEPVVTITIPISLLRDLIAAGVIKLPAP